jgi:hypothetical protein
VWQVALNLWLLFPPSAFAVADLAAAAAAAAFLLPQCKHQLAARLAYALKRCPMTVVPDSAIAQFLLDS